VLRINPTSGAAVGRPQKVPQSEGGGNYGRGQFALACQATCRVVYHDRSGSGLLSWGQGGGVPVKVRGPVGGISAWIAADWCGNGRLCIIWFENAGGYKVLFGNSSAARGRVATVGKPTRSGSPGAVSLIRVPNSASLKQGGVAIVGNWLGSSNAFWAKVVPAPPGSE
jgi:hypothetical protein